MSPEIVDAVPVAPAGPGAGTDATPGAARIAAAFGRAGAANRAAPGTSDVP